jgi:hypothetical protein
MSIRIRYQMTTELVVLGGVIVIMLTNGPKVRGFKLSRGRWKFKEGKKNRSTTSFGGEVKPSASCRKILRYAK